MKNYFALIYQIGCLMTGVEVVFGVVYGLNASIGTSKTTTASFQVRSLATRPLPQLSLG